MAQENGLKKFYMFFLRRSIVLFVGLLFVAVWVSYYGGSIRDPFFRKGNWLVVLLYLVLYYLFAGFYGGFRIGSQHITDTAYANILSLIIVNVITYLQIALISRGFLDISPLLLTAAAQVVVIIVWSYLVTKFYFTLFKPLRMVCLYGGIYPDYVVNVFSQIRDKFDISQSFRVTPESDCDYDALDSADGVVICRVPDQKYAEIMKYCVENNKRYYIVPTIGDILLRTSELIYLSDIPLLLSKNEGLYFGQRLLKRIIDVSGALVLLIITSPLMLIIAACIKSSDGGSILYRQKRCTYGGRIFEILKFRSMRENAEACGHAMLAAENDPRITPCGRTLRKYRLDELPQLFNILRGDMSFVGPRPERPELIEEYKKNLPEFDYRLNVKCGLTGFAQVIGRYNTTPEDKLKLDLIYIQTYSLLLDIKIILMTVKALFSKSSTDGVDCGKIKN